MDDKWVYTACSGWGDHDLELTTKFGLTKIGCNPTLTTTFGDGNYLRIFPNPADTAEEFARSLVDCAESFGVEIIREAEVKKILVKDGEAYGVQTADGQSYTAAVAVISEIEWPHIFNNFLEPDEFEALPASLKRGLKEIKYECGGVTLNVALDAMPDFGMPEECYGGFFGVTGPGFQYAEEAFAEYKCARHHQRQGRQGRRDLRRRAVQGPLVIATRPDFDEAAPRSLPGRFRLERRIASDASTRGQQSGRLRPACGSECARGVH